MATIEELEIRLSSKLSLAEQKLEKFGNNVNNIEKVIGKDPTYVYDVLLERHVGVKTQYANAINVNTGFLGELIAEEDNILAVLEEVMTVIDRIENASEDEAQEVREEISEEMDGIAEGVTEAKGPSGGLNLFGFIIPGLMSYAALRLMKVKPTVSFAASAAVSIILKK